MGKKFTRYAVFAGLGALAGGAAVIVISKTMPRVARAMMENMMSCMRKAGCDPGKM